MSLPPVPRTIQTVGPAIVASAVAVLPVPLVGGLAIFLQEDLGFGAAQLGTAIAAFFAAAALSAAPAGRLSELLGPRRIAWLGLGCIFVSLLGIAYVASSWSWLAFFLALAGLGHATTLLAVGVLLTRAVARRRLGLAFGVAQAAAPLAALLSGLAVPTIALTLGWEIAFTVGAVLALAAALVMPPTEARQRASRTRTAGDAPLSALVPLAAGMAVASAGANSSTVFLVSSTVDAGIRPADAGLILALASVVGLVVRVVAGWLGDRMSQGSLLLMAALIALGAVGYAGLAISSEPAHVAAAAVLAFGGGWGWPGLMLLAVSRSNPAAPGAAMGVVTFGGLGGAVFGPPVFGAIAEGVGFGAAWLTIAGLAVAAIGLIVLSWRRILAARPGEPT